MTGPSSTGNPGGHNRITEELRLLAEVLADRGQPWLDRVASHSAASELPATCEWCPLCAALAVLRGERSELAVRTADQVAGLLSMLRALIEQRGTAPAGGAAADGGDGTRGSSPGGRVQRIAVRPAGTHRPDPAPEPVTGAADAYPGAAGRVQRIAVQRAEPDR